MKRNSITVTSALLAGLLIGAIGVPAVAQQRRDRSQAESSWTAGASGEKNRVRNSEDGDRERGPRGERGERGPRGTRGDGPPPPPPPPRPDDRMGGPGIEGALNMGAALLRPFWENEDVVAELGLTADQVATLAESGDLTKAQLDETEGSIRDSAEVLRDVMQTDNPNITEVNDLIDGITAATNEKAKIVLGHAVVVKNTLSEEQEEQLKGLGHEMRRANGEEVRELMKEVKAAVQNGGTLDDVLNLIETSDLPPQAKERLVKFAEKRAEKALSTK